MKMFLLLVISTFVLMTTFVLVNRSILLFFPKDNSLRIWWVKNICDDLNPKD